MNKSNSWLNQPARHTTDSALRRSLWSIAIALTLACGGTSANPDNPLVVAGSADMQSMGNTLSITNSPGTIINWQGFSIDRNEITRFLQQNDQSAVLNRVTGGAGSNLLGELISNGKVFLINPNGIVIGNDARIDTAGFIGSTLDIKDDDFLAGRYRFKGDSGSIVNNGTITSGPGGEVVLIATSVENSGDISVVDGEIILAAGREVTLTSLSEANLSFRVSAPENKVLNIGSLTANSGAIGVFANQIMSSGTLSANRATTNSRGQIVLQADGSNEVGGTITATSSNVPGGQITILGDNIRLDAAQLDTTGTNGGQVLIGGEFQGNGSLPRANRTTIDSNSVIHADALERGNGGEIIVWSELATDSRGRLTARGGPVSGNGGLVETSSRGSLQFGQPADVSAANGAPGTWLLDPEDIVIDSAHADSISTALNGGSNVQVKTAESGTGEGNIAVNAPIRKTEGPDAALGLTAHNRIDINAPIGSTSGKLDVSLKAGKDIAVNAPVSTNGGSYSANIVPSLLPAEVVEEGEQESAYPGSAEATLNAAPDNAMEEEQDSVTTTPEADTAATPALSNEQVEVIVLNDNGINIDAAVSTHGGEVRINAGRDGLLSITDTISATGVVAGDVSLLGNQIAVYDNVAAESSGISGGGEILIGGDQQGLNPDISNAHAVYIAADAVISADAGSHGDGGSIIVYADRVATIDGRLTARGGSESGNGGFVETSGRDELRLTRAPDVSASNGSSGKWLIDPSTINITDDNSDPTIDTSTSPNGTTFTTTGNTLISTLSVSELAFALTNGTNVEVITSPMGTGTGDINLLAALDLDLFSGQGDSGSLTLNAHNDVNIRNSIAGSANRRLDNLTIVADSDGLNGGDINIDARGLGERLSILARGNLNLSGNNLIVTAGSEDNGEAVSVDVAGAFQFEIADSITVTSTERNSSVSLRARSNEENANRIVTENLTLASTSNSGFSRLTFIGPFPPAVLGEIRIADQLLLDGGSIGNDINIFTRDFVWNRGSIGRSAGSFNTSGDVTLDFDGPASLFSEWNVGSDSVVNWNDGNFSLQGTINNSGTFNANNDNLVFTGADASDGVFNNLTGGQFIKAASQCNPDCGATTFGADDDQAILSFNNRGSVHIEEGDLKFVQVEDFSNPGTLAGGFTQTAGETLLAGGNLVSEQRPGFNDAAGTIPDPGTNRFNGGRISGGLSDSIIDGGNVSGNTVLNDTTIAAGFSPGTLNFGGDLTVDDTSTFEIEIAGIQPDTFDSVTVGGTATLNNPLVNVTFDGYTPPDGSNPGGGDSFAIVTANLLAVAPSAPALRVTQPDSLPNNVDAFTTGVANTLLLNYVFNPDVTPINTDPITTVESDLGIPTDDPITAILVQTGLLPPGSRTPRTIGRPLGEPLSDDLLFDPISPVITLAGQTPEISNEDDGPLFLQCY